jgi:hypothetical protein
MKIGGNGIVLTDRWIEHWDLVCSSRPERERKCERYRSIRPEFDLSYCYLYEDEEIQTRVADEIGLRHAIFTAVGPVSRPELPIYRPSEPIDFRSAGNSVRYVCQGWSSQESWGTWTNSSEAEIFLPLETPFEGGAVVTVIARAFVASPHHPAIRVEVDCNGELAGVWDFDSSEDVEQSVMMPLGLIAADHSLRLRFRIYHPASPYGLGHSADRRMLGIGVSAMRVDPLPADPNRPRG